MIINLESFQHLDQKITTMVKTHKIDFIDAVLSYCTDNNIEPEVLGEIIKKNPNLKAKIELEAESLHFIKKQARLPI